MAITFALSGTLVEASPPDDPAAAVARELRARDVPVPADWAAASAETHVDAPGGGGPAAGPRRRRARRPRR